MMGKFQFILVWGGGGGGGGGGGLKTRTIKIKKCFFLLISDKSEIKNNPPMQLCSIVQNS